MFSIGRVTKVGEPQGSTMRLGVRLESGKELELPIRPSLAELRFSIGSYVKVASGVVFFRWPDGQEPSEKDRLDAVTPLDRARPQDRADEPSPAFDWTTVGVPVLRLRPGEREMFEAEALALRCQPMRLRERTGQWNRRIPSEELRSRGAR